MHRIEEVEVDSVGDLKSSQSIRGHRFPNFEMLDVKIAPFLKKIPHPELQLQEKNQFGRAEGSIG